MRIAFISLMAGSPWGASEVLWSDAAKLALSRGHQVMVSAYDWSRNVAAIKALGSKGAELHLRPIERWRRRSVLWSRLTGVFKPLLAFRPDVVCVSQGGTYDIARSGSAAVLRHTLERLDRPIVLLCHCEQNPPSSRISMKARPIFAQAAVVGVLAQRLRALAETQLGIALPNARIFFNPVNLARVERLPWPAPQQPLRLAYVGRLDPVKNLDTLIDVLGSSAWRERDWTLTVCGTGTSADRLAQRAHANGLQAKIRFRGYVEDIASIWREHHVLVMPSKFEGVPLAMVEAMLCGRPVAANDTGGISEWLDDECGFLMQGPSKRDVSTTLESLWDLRARLESLGDNAHRRAVAKRDPNPARTLLTWLEEAAMKSES